MTENNRISPPSPPPLSLLPHRRRQGRCTYTYEFTINGTADRINQVTYDFLGNATQIKQTGNVVDEIFADFEHNSNALLTSINRYEIDDSNIINDIANTLYTYNSNNAVTSITHQKPDETSIVQHSYTYDETNNIVEYLNSLDGQTSYDYDFLGQLIGAEYANQNLNDESYSYDSNGNRITANDSSYTTGTNNELTSDGTWSYVYDDEGNRLTKQNSTHRELYTWDYRNRLTKVTQQEYNSTTEEWQNVQIVEYAYDYHNVWIRKTLGTNTTIFIPENYQTTVQIDNNTATHHYLWTPGQQDKLLADTTTDGVLWTLTDHLGSIRDVIQQTSSGLVTQVHLVYDAFGNLISGTNPVLFAFTGKAFDTSAALQNNINRWYDPATGRWLSPDPIGFNGNDTNLYRYVKNAVLKFFDALGREPISSSIFNPVLGGPTTIPLPPTAANTISLEIISQSEDLTFENASNPNPLVAIVTFERSKCMAELACKWLEEELPKIRNLSRMTAITLVVEAPRIRNTALENLGAEKRNLVLQILGTVSNTNVLNDALALEQFSKGECFSAIKSVVIGHLSPQQISAALNAKDSFLIIMKEDQINREYENSKAQGEEMYERRYWY